MLSVGLHLDESVLRLLGQRTIEAIGHHLGEPQDRVERGPELVAHVGEELRLVAARELQLTALLIDVAEQARVLDRQNRLLGEGHEKLLRRLVELARLAATHDESAQDLVRPEERNDQHGAVAGLQHEIPDRRRRFVV